ncbi:unnamed protein product [Cladocopium goreaui]|uniref:Uncharacterized protein n=1 Tax=Cladocopium goreaui TaxID=2562237 RepID=A0A9P1GB38_9DINO|nr:unnamed protein product [Cladocopium goreaui]
MARVVRMVCKAEAEQLLASIRRLQLCSARVRNSLTELEALSRHEASQDQVDIEFTSLSSLEGDPFDPKPINGPMARPSRSSEEIAGLKDEPEVNQEELDVRRSVRQVRRGHLARLESIEELSDESRSAKSDGPGDPGDSDSSVERLWASVMEVGLSA